MIKVVQLFRRKNEAFFSIEKVFALLDSFISRKVELQRWELPYHTNGILSLARNLIYVSMKKRADVFHITGDVHYVALCLPRKRLILTIHDCVFLNNVTGLKRTAFKWLFLEMPTRRATIVTTISEFTRQQILQNSSCPPEKIVVVGNSINSNIAFTPKQFNEVKPVILFIGTTPNKNLLLVADALKGVQCHLKVLGRIPDAELRALQQNDIEFSSFENLSEPDLADAYAQCDIVLFPSTFEGFGLPILEGQKAGRVVITSNIEPMKTVAGAGAYLINPYKAADIKAAILLLSSDKQLRESLIEKAAMNVRNYAQETIAARYLALYETIASGTSS